MALSISTLITAAGKASIYEAALVVATDIGLPVTSWQPGDPTRSTYHVVAEMLSTLELVLVEFVKGAFLDLAQGTWLTVLAEQQYGVTEIEATFATTTLVLTNTKGAEYTFDAGDINAKNSSTGETFTNTSGGTLGPVGSPTATLEIDIVADEAGSGSTSSAGEIDTLVTVFNGVTCTNPTAAVGLDKEDKASLVRRCRAKLALLSPGGAADAYVAVALDPDLSGAAAVTRARTLPATGDGTITLVIAGPSGTVTGDDLDAVDAAVLELANPVMVTPIVESATPHVVDVTYSLKVYSSINKTSAEVEDEAADAIDAMLAAVPIGGDDGILSQSKIEAAIMGAFPGFAFRVAVSVPADDEALDPDEVTVAGTHTATITMVTP